MRLPSKVNTFSDSVIALFPSILTRLIEEDMTAHELLEGTKTTTSEISAFIDALDCLFALGRIGIREGAETLYYVEANNV
jgi:hypothetical protein